MGQEITGIWARKMMLDPRHKIITGFDTYPASHPVDIKV
jgi:hypothetical protein